MAYHIGTYLKNNKKHFFAELELGADAKGKRLRHKKRGFTSEKEAKKYATEYQYNIDKGLLIATSKDIMFKDFLIQWFEDYKSKSLSLNTKNNYRVRINNHILPYLEKYKLSEIDTMKIQNLYNDLIKKNLKPATAKKVLEILKSCFKYAIKMRLITIMPTDIETQKLEKPTIKYWNQDQVNFFLNVIKDEYLYTPILIDILTGLRVAELCGLRWRDVDLESGYITVNTQIIFDRTTKILIPTKVLKTSTSHRKISIPTILIEHLKAIYEDEKPPKSDFVIKNRYGLVVNPRNLSMEFTKKIGKYKKSIDDIVEETGETPKNYMQLPQITFHGLRHTHATLLIANGENVKVVSERLGHKDITTTLNTYTHVMEEMKNDTASLLDNMFKAKEI